MLFFLPSSKAIKAMAAGVLIGEEVAVGAAVISLINGIVGAAMFNNIFLLNEKNLSDRERNARSAGRHGTYAGAFVGFATVYEVISAVCSVTGARNILPAVGGILGGGITLGAVMLIVVPPVIVAAVGKAVYGVTKFFDVEL